MDGGSLSSPFALGPIAGFTNQVKLQILQPDASSLTASETKNPNPKPQKTEMSTEPWISAPAQTDTIMTFVKEKESDPVPL